MQHEGAPDAAADSRAEGEAAARPHPRRSLRTFLTYMVVAPVLPLVLVCAVAVWLQWQSQQRQVNESLSHTASAIAVAVGREFDRNKAILETLAASELIDAQDWAAFHRVASKVSESDPGSVIALTEPSGRQPVRTVQPFGAPTVNPLALAATPSEAEWNGRRLPVSSGNLAQRVFESGKTVGSNMYYGVTTKKPTVAIAVPVLRGGTVAYVLIKSFPIDGLVKLLQDADRSNVRINLIDGNGRIIARNVDPLALIGAKVTDALQAASKTVRRGNREGLNADGQVTMSAFHRLDEVDWFVNVSMPRSTALAGAAQQAVAWSLICLAMLALGAFAARRVWLRVEPPITSLGRSARALQRGERVEIPRSDIAEIDDLAHLLHAAGAAGERERVEATGRAVAEESERATRALVVALRESEARFRMLFEHSGTGIVSVDLKTGRYVLVNHQFSELTGYPEEELLRMTFADVTHPDDVQRDRAGLRALLDGTAATYDAEKRYVRKDGQIRWAQVHVRHFVQQQGDEPFTFASINDITERKEAELALQEADRRKDEFLATLAHELRNPLAPLRSGIQILELRHDDAATVARVSAVMKRQVSQMVRLIDDLLDVSRITTGQLQLQDKPVDLAQVVAGAVEACQPAFDAGGHACTVAIDDAPLMVRGDAMRLIQVVENLLTNAAKYSDTPGRIAVRAYRRGDRAVLEVADTGIGIPPDKLDVIFGMFAQIRGVRGSGAERGLGIGLHIVRRLVELHGGTVTAASAGEGKGSAFMVELPLLEASAAAADAAAAQKTESGTPATTAAAQDPLDILVVDDNLDATEALATLLGLYGHAVRTAASGGEALACIAASCPQVVLLDLGMAHMDGFEVARRVRALDLPRQPVLVAVSGWGQERDKRLTAEAGFDHHLVKPVDVESLLGILQAVTREGAPQPGRPGPAAS